MLKSTDHSLMPLRRTQAPGSTIHRAARRLCSSSRTWKQRRPGDVECHAAAANTGAGQHDDLLILVLQEGTSQVLMIATPPWGPAALWDRCVVVSWSVPPA
ncbi:hypothetical protein MTO96_049738 [Rhipicephalus appendiculatus]